MSKKPKTVTPAKQEKTAQVAKPARKLSKKAQLAQDWGAVNLRSKTSEFLRGSIADVRTANNDANIGIGGEIGQMVIGVPLPSLSAEYLFCNTVFPLSRLVILVGPPGTCKSGLAFEIGRWFLRRSSGITYLIENESKYSPDWALSIMGQDAHDILGVIPSTSINDWQTKMQGLIAMVKKSMIGTKTEPGPGRVFPVLMILDSLMGKLSEETINNMEQKGHADRHHPIEAQMITDFFKKIPADIDEMPISLFVINHLKKSIDPRTNTPVRGRAGGKHMEFQETFEIEIGKRARCDFVYAPNPKTGMPEIKGKRLSLDCYKNSLGDGNRQIPIDVCWWSRKVNGKMIQQTVWDWFGSTVLLLLDDKTFSAAKLSQIREIVDLNVVKSDGAQPTLWSKKLGIPKESPVPFSVAGKLIQQDATILNGLRDLLDIKRRPTFVMGEDYLIQVERQRKLLQEELAKRDRLIELRAKQGVSGYSDIDLACADLLGGANDGSILEEFAADLFVADTVDDTAVGEVVVDEEEDVGELLTEDKENDDEEKADTSSVDKQSVLPGDGGKRKKPLRRRPR